MSIETRTFRAQAILRLLGLDHERLTFYHNGFRRRPTPSLALIQRRSQTFEPLAYCSLHACAPHGGGV